MSGDDSTRTSGEDGSAGEAAAVDVDDSPETADQGASTAVSLERRIEAFREWVHEWLHGLYHGMVEHPAFEKIEKEAEDVEDVFLFACFADAFGIPSPVSYYTVELLPYLAGEFEQWERRMWDRDSLIERKGQQYHVH